MAAFVFCAVGRVDIDGIRLSFWDLGGQEELQILWDKYYSECHAIIYVVDSSASGRLSETRDSFGTSTCSSKCCFYI